MGWEAYEHRPAVDNMAWDACEDVTAVNKSKGRFLATLLTIDWPLMKHHLSMIQPSFFYNRFYHFCIIRVTHHDITSHLFITYSSLIHHLFITIHFLSFMHHISVMCYPFPSIFPIIYPSLESFTIPITNHPPSRLAMTSLAMYPSRLGPLQDLNLVKDLIARQQQEQAGTREEVRLNEMMI